MDLNFITETFTTNLFAGVLILGWAFLWVPAIIASSMLFCGSILQNDYNETLVEEDWFWAYKPEAIFVLPPEVAALPTREELAMEQSVATVYETIPEIDNTWINQVLDIEYMKVFDNSGFYETPKNNYNWHYSIC